MMATLDVSGGYVLLGSTGAIKTDSVGSLKRQIASVVGGGNDPDILMLAYDAIVMAVRRVNMKHVFDFTKETQADADLVADQREYSVPADAFSIRVVELIKADGSTNDGPIRTLTYEDPEALYIINDRRSDTGWGTPSTWTVENLYDDRQIHLYPIPQSSDADKYDLRIHYHKRIEKPSDSNNVAISAPEELSEAILVFGWAHICRMRAPERNLHQGFMKEFNDMVGDFKASRQRSTPGPRIMRVASTGRFFSRRGRR